VNHFGKYIEVCLQKKHGIGADLIVHCSPESKEDMTWLQWAMNQVFSGRFVVEATAPLRGRLELRALEPSEDGEDPQRPVEPDTKAREEVARLRGLLLQIGREHSSDNQIRKIVEAEGLAIEDPYYTRSVAFVHQTPEETALIREQKLAEQQAHLDAINKKARLATDLPDIDEMVGLLKDSGRTVDGRWGEKRVAEEYIKARIEDERQTLIDDWMHDVEVLRAEAVERGIKLDGSTDEALARFLVNKGIFKS